MAVEIDIDHVARLARLALTEDEKSRLRDQIAVILDHAAKVSEVAADDVPPTSYAIPRANVYRDDLPEPSLPQAEALANAPETEDGRIKVVRIVEADG
jgi:aspartyl-tRNA(Asn)/glutamyl-tRNA(Gln) amidotransferase subunit C